MFHNLTTARYIKHSPELQETESLIRKYFESKVELNSEGCKTIFLCVFIFIFCTQSHSLGTQVLRFETQIKFYQSFAYVGLQFKILKYAVNIQETAPTNNTTLKKVHLDL